MYDLLQMLAAYLPVIKAFAKDLLPMFPAWEAAEGAQ